MENKKEFIDKFLDFIFSKNNIKYLILLFIIGFFLRGMAANNLSPNADEMVHGTHALGILESKKLQIMDQDAVWFYLTDIFYKTFGENLFGLRFMSILFGSLSIIVIYLIGRELFNKRTALLASFILTLSSYHIAMTLAEMDTSMVFFILLSMYLLIKALKEQKNVLYILSSLFLGMAIMIKQIAVLLVPVFFLFILYYNRKDLKLKKLVYVILIVFIAIIPILTFNYLLYKDKGLVDLQFSRFLGISKETYSSIELTLKPFRFNDLFFSYENHPPGLIEGGGIVYKNNTFILIFGLLGLIISFVRNKEFSLLLLGSLFAPFIFLSGTSLLSIHFIFTVPLLSLFSANLLDVIILKFENKFKKISYLIIILIILLSTFFIQKDNLFRGKSEITKLIEFKKENINYDSLVIVDSRVYRGRIVLAFNDKHYLEANYLNELVQKQKNLPGTETNLNTYFIECVTDDCGWGTINNQPDFNESMEEVVNFFRNNSRFLITIKDSYGENYFNIYNTKLRLKESSLELADSTHEWFYYPVRYKGKSFDDYKVSGFIDKSLDKIAHYILYLEIFLVLMTPFYISYLLFKKENEN